MALETPFTCPNGHNFIANAKLRARCPECGVLARKSFQSKPAPVVASTDTEQSAEAAIATPPVAKPAIKRPVILRQGKEMPRKAAPKPPVKPPPTKPKPKTAAKVSGGLVTTNKVRRGVTPTIKRTPKRTAPARHVVGESSKGVSGYLSAMMRRAGF